MPITILVADAHRLVSDGLSCALRQHSDLEVLDVLPVSGQEVVAEAKRRRPDVVVLDYWMPGMEASAATRLLVAGDPSCRVLIVSWVYGIDHIRESLEAGAVGFLPKSIRISNLVDAVRRAYKGERPVLSEELKQMATTIHERSQRDDDIWQRLALLTGREIEILKLLDEGVLIPQIAKSLSIKVSTVRNHLHNILEKTGVQTHMQAASLARHHGLIRS